MHLSAIPSSAVIVLFANILSRWKDRKIVSIFRGVTVVIAPSYSLPVLELMRTTESVIGLHSDILGVNPICAC